jgi:hypothetical protein
MRFGVDRLEVPQVAAASAALQAGMRQPLVPSEATRTRRRTDNASAAIAVQWWRPFVTASMGGRCCRCAEVIRAA